MKTENAQKNINDELLETLFIRKKVRFQQDFFDEYFDYIFPNKNEFSRFLVSSGRDAVILHGINIVDCLLFCSPYDGMQNLYSNLLNMESSLLNVDSTTFTFQDHAVHSVNVYILGIYLYFNVEEFNYSLGNYFRRSDMDEISISSNEEIFFEFIESWKYFSVLHDLAYPFERLFDLNENIIDEKYKEFLAPFEEFGKITSFTLAKECFAHLIVQWIIQNDSKGGISTGIKKKIKKMKIIGGKEYLSDNPIWTDIDKYTQISYLYSERDFAIYEDWLKGDKISLLRDKEYNIVSVIVYNGGDKAIYIAQGKKELKEDIINSSKSNKFYFEYYIKGGIEEKYNEVLKEFGLLARKKDLDEIGQLVQKRISPRLVLLHKKKNIRQIAYFVNLELNIILPMEYKDMVEILSGSANKVLSENSEILLKICSEIINNELKNRIVVSDNIFNGPQLRDTIQQYKSIDWEKIWDEVEKVYYEVKGKKDNIENNIREIMRILLSISNIDETMTNVTRIHDLIDNSKNNIDKNLYKYIKKYLIQENFIDKKQNIKDFYCYKPSYSSYDHGIMVFIFMVNYRKMQEKAIKNFSNKYTFKLNGICSKRVHAEVMYSILVHNIYSNIYALCCDRMPQHDLRINAFSYFAMFCDNLQIWNRDRGINYGLVKVENAPIYAEDFSISTNGGAIQVKCKTNDIKTTFIKLKQSLGEYLNGAEDLIILDLMED